MSSFNYITEIQKIIDSKELVEVRVYSNPGMFNVAYVLGANQEFLVLAEIDPKANLDGVCVYQMENVISIKQKTPYLAKFSQKISDQSQYNQAYKDFELLTDLTFEGFIADFEGKDAIIEVLCDEGETVAGKIVAHDEHILVLTELDSKKGTTEGTTYLNKDAIIRLSVDVPWIKKLIKK
jgi:hypothetical protein